MTATLALLMVVAAVFLPAVGDAPAQQLPLGQGRLWMVERIGLEASYLFATVHVTDERVRELPDSVREAFDGARTIASEVVLDQEARLRLGQAMLLPKERSLDQILGGSLFARVVSLAGSYGLSESALMRFKPWALTSVFSYPPEELQSMAKGDPALDEWLQEEARLHDIPLVGLETVHEQIALFDGLTESQQVNLVRGLLANSDELKKSFERTVDLYLEGDIAGIHAQMVEQAAAGRNGLEELFEERFIVERNLRMVERMRPLLKRGNAFIAVGALHLPGERGILRLLQRRHYTVTRIH